MKHPCNLWFILLAIFICTIYSCQKKDAEKANQSPIANFTISPSSGTTSTSFTFDASGSTDSEDASSSLQVRWDWNNDGIWDTEFSSNKVIQHTYSVSGTYNVAMEVRDTKGLSNSLVKSVKVNEQVVLTPVLTTIDYTEITQSSIKSGGNITSQGGSSITSRGLCWSKQQNPTIADEFLTNGSGTGQFTSKVTGLENNVTIYLRAYATNSYGTGYGQEISFTIWLNEPGPNLTDVDGNSYSTIKIGNQIWMKENLNVTHYKNNSSIPNVSDSAQWVSLTTGAFSNYDNEASNGYTYGKLYNWFAVKDSRGLCPSGWHAPTDGEYQTLEMFLGMTSSQASGTLNRGTDEGGKLKQSGYSYWISPNEGATNESGFTALPGGMRGNNALFVTIDEAGYWWTVTMQDATYPYIRGLHYSHAKVYRLGTVKQYGLSVRCIKD
jgi:uncharacterized protein (TIGR02145 family)